MVMEKLKACNRVAIDYDRKKLEWLSSSIINVKWGIQIQIEHKLCDFEGKRGHFWLQAVCIKCTGQIW